MPDRAELLRQQAKHHRAIAESLEAEAAIVGAVVVGEEYLSCGPRPVGTSRRTFREECASGAVEGATKDGKVWRCSRAAWHAARAKRTAPPSTPAVVLEKTDEARAREMIERAGYRLTRDGSAEGDRACRDSTR